MKPDRIKSDSGRRDAVEKIRPGNVFLEEHRVVTGKAGIAGMLWMVAVVLAVGSAAAASGPAKNAKAAQTSAASSPLPASLAHAYGGFWQVGPGYSTTLTLKNKDRQKALAVNLVLFSSSGQTEQTIGLQLGPNVIKRVELADIFKPADVLVHGGGLALQFDSAAAGVIGQIDITRVDNGSSVSLPLGGGYQWDNENALYAPWWLPDAGSQGSVRLFNSSNQTIVVQPSLMVQGARQAGAAIKLGAHESRQVSLRALLGDNPNATLGMITLRYSGPTHALQPVLLLDNGKGGWLASDFQALRSGLTGQLPQDPPIRPVDHSPANTIDPGSDAGPLRSQSRSLDRPSLPPAGSDPLSPVLPSPAGAIKTGWQFPEIKLEWAAPASKRSLHAYALISNPNDAAMPMELKALFGGGKTSAVMQDTLLPTPALAAQETRLVDLSMFIESVSIKNKPERMALVASHEGMPGALAITVFSVTQTQDQVFSAAGALLPAGVSDVSYWQIQGKIGSPRGVRNDENSQMQAQMVLYYPGLLGVGSYVLPAMTLESHQEQTVRLGSIARLADERGAVAPAGTLSGLAAVIPSLPGSNQALAADQSAICERECSSGTAQVVSNISSATVGSSGTANSSSPGIVGDFAIIVTHHVHITQHIHVNININVNQRCFPPEFSVSPNTGNPGDTVDVTLSGDFLPRGPSVGAGGISVTNVQWLDENTITATFTIPSTLEPGPQNVTVSGTFGLGTSAFTVAALTPSISTVSPNHGQAGQSVTVQITGSNFRQGDTIEEFGGPIGSGPPSVSSPTSMSVTFTIPPDAALGSHSIEVRDPGGSLSNAANFQVDPIPVIISSVSPSPWQAGSSFTVTISGSGFGTDPLLDISDPAGAVIYSVLSATPTAIQASVTVDPLAPSEDASITVTANDAPLPATQPATKARATAALIGVPASATVSVPITAAPAALSLKLTFFGSNVTNNKTAKTVFVGQQIALRATISNIPSGVTITSEQWTMPDGTVVAGFDDGHGGAPSATGGKAEQLQATTCSNVVTSNVAICDANKFYWVDQGDGRKLTFSYTLSNQASDTANATFNVQGPTGVGVVTQVCPNPVTVSHHANSQGVDQGLFLGFGDPSNNKAGISFQATASSTPSGGTYQWAQLITGVSIQYQLAGGRQVCTQQDDSSKDVTSSSPALDSVFPYPVSSPGVCGSGAVTGALSATGDTPGVSVGSQTYWEVAEDFSATMYLMWSPAKPSGCTDAAGSPCSIPVPLGSIPWAWSGETVNRKGKPLPDDWTTGCGAGGASETPAFIVGTDFPQWNSVVRGSFFGGTPSPQNCTAQ
jgi:hypothetical protein